ncbi:MAG: arginine--tRNA ligase [Raoultibacter sp.]
MQIREQLENLVNDALKNAIDSGKLALDEMPEAALERPRDESNGDWASTVALRCAKPAKMNPRQIAQIIVEALPENDLIAQASIAGAGFINLTLAPAVFQGVARAVRTEKGEFGKGEIPAGESYVNLEYVSANPTGPMHVGHGRWATLGDAMARVMRHAGYNVYEEFYINDHGTQMDIFGTSVAVRYLQLLGQEIEMPENSYGGGYVKDIAQGIIDRDGEKWVNVPEEERMAAFRELAYNEMLQDMRDTLAGFGNHFECWFSERSLYVEGPDGTSPVTRSLASMKEKGYIYENEGAIWFKSTAFGDEKDRVCIKENGEYTYFMSDVAYHYDKLERGFDHLINIWGADHHGYVKRCEAMLEAWGRPGALEVVLGQLVNLYRDGEAVRMSKRTGEMVTFKELIEEVGVDATRYLMLSRSSDQPIDFDIEAAKKKDASNPVYYVQYAHARICSILRKVAPAEAVGAVAAGTMTMDELADQLIAIDTDLTRLVEPSELTLMRTMSAFGELVATAARDRAPFRLTHYAQDLAGTFHQFYTTCHVIGEDAQLQAARLYLLDATRIVLAKALNLLGVSAPTEM